MARKYVSFTADDAISNILDWVDQGNMYLLQQMMRYLIY